MRDFEIEHYNISSQKWYGNLYKQFKKKLVISEQYLEKMLKSKFTKHFYSSSQIDEFYRCVHK
ncbi:putative capsular polysaccharide synthesis family protein [Microcoleus sp. LEGE 07076]|uniref:putative capsular polysaccharide synthesis family protein n=1 Tax=Microcoleus sp. LEGE 07076 TaxID=915322 RepID=UPI001D14F92C|nr:putative capsular polysaccharide synthesis family protein [Microcoleus sp. LEGE 07076]